MKITVKEDGSLKIDGEHRTVIYGNRPMKLKHNGTDINYLSDFIKIESDEEIKNHEVINFIFKCISNGKEELI